MSKYAHSSRFQTLAHPRLWRVIIILLCLLLTQLQVFAGRIPFVSTGPTLAHAAGPVITSVSVGGNSSSPTITINGSGFGTAPPATPAQNCAPTPTLTGSNYGTQLHFLDFMTNISFTWNAGEATSTGCDFIGLLNLTYSDTQITYQFGSASPGYGSLNPGDSFTVFVGNVKCSGIVASGFNTTVQCPNYVVTASADTNDSVTGCVAGTCSLRDAINDADALIGVTTPPASTIQFNIPGAGVHTIAVASPLPPIAAPVTIDGWSQGGASYTGPPLVQIDGTNLATTCGNYGLNVQYSNTVVRGLAINNVPLDPSSCSGSAGGNGFGIGVFGNISGVWLYGNYIGVDPATLAAKGNGQGGIWVNSPTGTLIGARSGDSNAQAEANVIAYNGAGFPNGGILVAGGNASATTIRGNTIHDNHGAGVDIGSTTQPGTTVTANSIYGNTGGGIALRSGANNNQAAPNLLVTQTGANGTTFGGSGLAANTTYTVEFFANLATDAPPCQGRAFLGSAATTTDASGNFVATIANTIPNGDSVDATVTDGAGNTSTFSACNAANDTWTNAQTLDVSSGSAAVSQVLYAPHQERWYRFLVTPGSSVHVSYNGAPGAILSLHSDLQSEYSSLTNPTSAALESAKDAPSSFLPSSFLPSSFLPSSFLPSSFLPSSFLPSSFLPSSFLPSSFLPSSFLPSSFLPSSFLPSSFLPGPYSGAVYASLLALSATPNSGVQTIDHDTWNSFGYFYVRVTAPANASTPFNLTVTESGGICAGVSNVPVTPPAASSIPTGLKTLILWDPTRIAGTASDVSTLGTKLAQFAQRPEVQGAVIDLSQISGIEAAQQQADNNAACPTAKNIVADDVKSVIQAYRAPNSGLQYIVLAGDDHSIPFFRYPDESGLAPESQYYPPVADASASNASLRDNYVLGQDEYGASLDLPLSDVSLPIPDLAVGRLVDSASEVSHLLDVYTATNGVITPTSSLVTGYDFVADAATNAATELQAGTNTTPDTLISPQGQAPSANWTADDLRQKLLGSRHDVVFLAGHFSAGNLEAADYATTLSAAEVASSTVDMSNTLVLALGCHGGYNIPGGDAVPNLSPAPNWPEALAEKGATLLSATGYAYGDTVLTEYGEHLFDNYVRQLRSYAGASYVPVAVGQADVAAKKEYLTTHANLTGVDEKTLLETTLYGLPMLHVNMTGQHVNTQPPASIVASAPVVSSGPGQQFSLGVGQTSGGSSDIDVQPTLTSHSVQLTNAANNSSVTATYLTGPDGDVARPGEPIFPLQLFNVHVPNQILRGVGFRGGNYSDTPHVTPLTSATGTETSVGHPAFYTNDLYPTQVWTANYFDAINGGPERLVTTPAQYVSTSPGSTDGTLRQFSDLKFRLFYLPGNWTTTPISQAATAAAPNIGSVAATADSSGNVTFNVHVLNDPTAGTQGVWITYTDPNNPGTWQSIDLGQSSTDPTLWTATQSLPGSIVFMVQAVNGTGLVSLDTNSGAYFAVGSGAQPSVTTPTTVTVQAAPSSGVYQTTSGAFQVSLQAAGSNGPAPLSGQMVTLQLGDQQAFATTDANGNASITLPLNQPPGSYTAVATFGGASAGGTTYLASSSAPGAFTITPAPTTLSLAPSSGASATYGAGAPLTATLTGNTGAGLVQRTVVFTVTGNGLTYNKTAITDFLGRAALGAVPLPAGTYAVTAAFGGADHPVQVSSGGSTVTESDPNYLTSSAAPASLTITPEQSSAAYSGDTVDPISTTVHLTATVTRADDAFLDDLTLAQVQFAAVDPSGNVVATATAPVADNGLATATLPGTLLANVYTISTTVTGGYFTSPASTALLAVYNPNGGFVTGGGWIASQPGWCQLASCSSSGGKATFGFNSRYKSGTTTPTGETEFRLDGLDLESTGYQWMTISGNFVQLQGVGTVNGSGSYDFMLTAIDGDMGGPQNGTDYFRVQIWNPGSGAVIYDSQPGAPANNAPTTPLGGGNIVIHSS